MLEGPTAIAFIESSGDPAAVAKALAATAKETNVLTLRGGCSRASRSRARRSIDWRRCRPLDVLRGQLVGAIVAPITQLLALVSAPLRDLHGLIDARIAQLEEQGEVVGPVAEAAVETEEPGRRRTAPRSGCGPVGGSACRGKRTGRLGGSRGFVSDTGDTETEQAETQQEEEQNGD